MKDLWRKIFPITLPFDARLSWPLCGYTEIGNFEDPLRGDKYVRWFQVEMDEVGVMDVLDALSYLH